MRRSSNNNNNNNNVYFLKQSFYKWKNERKKQKNKVSIGYPFFALGVTRNISIYFNILMLFLLSPPAE